MILKTNDALIHYEIYGEKSNKLPLVFMHGNGENLHIFDEIYPYFKEQYIITIDSRMQGESTGEEISYELMKEDLINLLTSLDIPKCNFIGFSDGAIVGLLASMETNIINKLFMIGLNISPKGLKKAVINGIKIMAIVNKISSLFNNKAKSKHKLLKLMLNEPRIKISRLRSVNAKAILFYGNKDMVKYSHALEIKNNLPNPKFYLLNGTHFLIKDARDEVVKIIKEELNE